MKLNQVFNLAEIISELKLEKLPADLVDHARLVMLDTVGVMVGGSGLPYVSDLRQRIGLDGSGEVTCPGMSGGFTPIQAAFWSGLCGSSLEYDEGNSYAGGHPGIQIVPSVLATSQSIGASGGKLLTGLISGYEVAVRLSRASVMQKGLHPTGTWGVVGSALGVGKALGRGPEELLQVANIAASYCLSPYVRNSFAGHNVAATFAAMTNHNAVLANQLFDGGIRADERCLEMTFGRFLSDKLDMDLLLDGLGDRWFIRDNYFKPYPTCRFTHPAVDALIDILARTETKPHEVDRVEVISYSAAAHGGNAAPANVEALRFSLAYQLAILLVHGTLGLDTITEGNLLDPEVRRMAEKIEIKASPDYDAQLPEKFPALVKVWYKNREPVSGEVFYPLGGPQRPFGEPDLLEKFISLTEPVLGPEKTAHFIHDYKTITENSDIRLIFRHLGKD